MQKLPFKVDLRCLESGQSFRWKRNGLNEWTGLIDKSIVTFKQVEQTVEFDVRLGPTDIAKQVFDYFQLKEDWDNLLDSWRLDSNFSKVSVGFENLRILRQDPVENVFSFICSSNNNISRITSMIDNLCKKYGEYVGTIEQIDHYTFPQPQQLVDSEETLRELGFGYRAKYIQGAARLLVQKGKDYLYSLREMSYEQAKEELLQIPGVGPKVADCICLMSLDKSEAVPVDTHVWQIASRDYNFTSRGNKSMTAKNYQMIADKFRHVFPVKAGWAQTILFVADLKQFREELIRRHEE